MTLEQVIEIIERYKLRIPPTVYYELLADVRNEQEPQTFKWCTDCKEYDQEQHCCHRWSKVIRDTVAEMKQEPKTDKYEHHIDHTDCIWYGSDSGCPVTCSQYRDGWNDAMDYIFKNGKGYQPYRQDG